MFLCSEICLASSQHCCKDQEEVPELSFMQINIKNIKGGWHVPLCMQIMYESLLVIDASTLF